MVLNWEPPVLEAHVLIVNPQCDCQHNTAGVNCERCADLYNDLPWAPAEEDNTHTCKRCECNNHAQRCHFDRALFEASGRRSGGVCEGCLHHTMGPKCDQCVPGYQPNPRSRMDRPDACTRCLCSAEGTVNGGQCDDSSGSCYCKVHVEGRYCDQCKRGYYGLDAANPDGCTKCSCSVDGSFSDVCDPVTAQCSCRLHFQGLRCDLCAEGYWKQKGSIRCERCGCDADNALSDMCDQQTGQCQCRPGFGGRTCTECPDNTYGDPLFGCQRCRCVLEGTELCDKRTGACLCRLGVTGALCDSCSRGHCDSFPACEMCPSCFFVLDAQTQNLSSALERLHRSLPPRPGGPGDVGDFGPRIQKLVDRLKLIRDSIVLPPSSAKQISEALSDLDQLRDQLDDIELSPLDRKPSLNPELDKIQDLLDKLNQDYKTRNGTWNTSTSGNSTGDLSAIKNSYDESRDASKKVESTGKVVNQSAAIRQDTIDQRNEVQPANTRDLEKLNQTLATRPDLTPVAKQVCGSVRSEPCTPLQCDGGNLCSPDKVPPCAQGTKCVGALPLSNRAVTDAQDVKDRLHRITDKIRDAAEELEDTQDATNEVRMQTETLSNKSKEARDELDDGLKKAQDAVKKLKDFLSDPSANLTHVKDVSDWILKTKDSLNLDPLKKKQLKLEELVASLPDSTAVLKDAEPQLDKARNLLQKAKDTRNTSLEIKDNVDTLLKDLLPAEDSMLDLEGNLLESLNKVENLNKSLTKTKDQLDPAQKALDDLLTLLSPMTPQLDKLKEVLMERDEQADNATDQADKADKEAAAAKKDLLALEKELDRLKAADSSGPGDGSDSLGERLARLQQDAEAAVNTTADMMNALEGKADSLKSLQDEILKKSIMVPGLEARLQELIAELHKRLHTFNTCLA
ncbi:laminin subunit beta-3 [Thalassophryne amazonica]|uniref:laminin subunit beta-3 n=1 Tax=Thalassophryne amazonica TaxID=390379 RepID=UPI0014714081|nr:laminin subunit beta-3 [Thalassophryne amazonica]